MTFSLFRFSILMLMILTISCERSTVIRDEIEYIDKPHAPCVAAAAPIYHAGEMLYGRVAGLKNCLPFAASAELDLFTTDIIYGANIILQTFEDWGNIYVRHELILVGAQAADKGTYSMYFPAIDDYAAHYFTLQDFDVLEDVFEIDTAYTRNEITFLELDKSKGYARGYFDCRFLLAGSSPSGNNPDTVVFTDCYFEAWTK